MGGKRENPFEKVENLFLLVDIIIIIISSVVFKINLYIVLIIEMRKRERKKGQMSLYIGKDAVVFPPLPFSQLPSFSLFFPPHFPPETRPRVFIYLFRKSTLFKKFSQQETGKGRYFCLKG